MKGSEVLKAVVAHKDDKTRFDIYLSRAAGISRAAASRLIVQELARVDSKSRKPSFNICAGMVVTWELQDEKPSRIVPWDANLNILYDDDSILVIDKPPGIVVHPGAGNNDKTLVNVLMAKYPKISGVGSTERPGIVHRLDKLTSGVMVIAKTQQAYVKLSEAFKRHSHKRVYICICFGSMKKTEGRIESFINRNPADRKKMTSKSRSGRQAATKWEVVKSWPGFSMLKLELETGRTHQIRVHLSDAGHPVVGDHQYGGRTRALNIANASLKAYVRDIERQLLHAHILGIEHPVTGEYMEFVSELPEDIILLQDTLERNYS